MKNAVALQLMTIQQAYRQLLESLFSVYSKREAINIAHWVIEHVSGRSKIDQIVYKDFPISIDQQNKLEKICNELLQHKPVQYVLGEAWFSNLTFFVNEKVLIPRPETEELVEWVRMEIESRKSKVENGKLKSGKTISILDVGTGSGCIPITIKKYFPFANVSAIDVSAGAIGVAKKNSKDLHVDINWITLDFLDHKNWSNLGTYDIIISNPPYIKQQEENSMMANVLKYEPHIALFVPDNNALVFYHALSEFGKSHISENGKIFMEINEAMGNEVKNLFVQNGYDNVEVKKDMQGKDRMVKAEKEA